MSNIINYELLRKIINEEDPLGLIDFDTPESLNEYEPELREILKKDISLLGNEELGQWIYQIFIIFFSEKLVNGKEKYNLIAKKFLASIHDKTYRLTPKN